MKHYRCIQGSAEWLRLRMGKPTASAFEKLITPAKWEPTKGETRRAYQILLLTELILDEPLTTTMAIAGALMHEQCCEQRAGGAPHQLAGRMMQIAGNQGRYTRC